MSGGVFIVPPDPDNPDALNAPTAEQLSAAMPVEGVVGVQIGGEIGVEIGGTVPEVATADDPWVRDCTTGGVDHDYRSYLGPRPGTSGPGATRDHTYLRCVWCHAVTCGDATETDPCVEPYHHRVPHRTRLGKTWPIGGTRP